MKKYILLVFIFSCSFCEGQSWLWGRQASGFGQEGNAVANDSIGNVLETGYFVDTLVFGSDTLYGKYDEIYLVKYDSNGNELWVKSSQSPSNFTRNDVYAVNTDNIGNSYITGFFTDTISFGADTLYSNQYENTFLVKYSPGGNMLWAKSATRITYFSWAQGVCVYADNKGNSYLTGYFVDTMNFDGNTLITSSRGNTFLIKYDVNGNVLWAKNPTLVGRSSQTIGGYVSADKLGNSYLTGYFYDTIRIGSYTLYSNKSSNLFVAKYDPNGNVLWAKSATSASSASSSYATSISTDLNGNSYVAGVFRDTIYFGVYSISTPPSAYYNSFLANYDANGNIKWVKNAIESNSHSSASVCSASADNFGNVYISGQLYDTVSFGTITVIEDTSYGDGAFIVKYDSLGNALCGVALVSGGDDQNGITADRFGNAYFGGDFEPRIFILGKDTLNNRSSSELAFIAKWKPCDFPTGIDQIIKQNTGVLLYPNPNNGLFTITCHSESAVADEESQSILTIYNMLGEKVFSINNAQLSIVNSPLSINLGNQPNGIYLYRVMDESGELLGSGKFIIQK